MIPCPHKTNPAYKELESEFGPEKAFLAWHRAGHDQIPSVEQARGLLNPAEDPDRAYMKAAESDDMETAGRMVDEAAKKAGYTFPALWHGTSGGKFDQFDFKRPAKDRVHGQTPNTRSVVWLTDHEKAASMFGLMSVFKKHGLDTSAVAMGLSRRPDGNLKTMWPELADEVRHEKVYIKGDFKTFEMNPKAEGSAIGPAVNQVIKEAREEGKDGVIFKNLRDVYIQDNAVAVFRTASIKSADPITRDAQGNIIPLSERFNPSSPSILQAPSPSPSEEEPAHRAYDPMSPPMPGTTEPPPPTGSTGVRNAEVDEQRIARGLPPRFQPMRRTFGKVWDEALAAINANYDVGSQLVAELLEKPRPLTDLEDAILTHEQLKRQQAQEDAVLQINEGPDDQRDAAMQRFARAKDSVHDVYTAGQAAGTANARGLNARKLAIQDDYTLTSMRNKRRAALGGKWPSKEREEQVEKEIQELHAKIETLEKELAKKDKERTSQLVEEEIPRMKSDVRKGGRRSLAKHLEAQKDEALKRLLSMAAALGPDTLGAPAPAPNRMEDLATVGAWVYETGHRTRGEWDEEMIGLLGESIRPELDDIFQASQERRREANEQLSGSTTVEGALSAARQGLNSGAIRNLAAAHLAKEEHTAESLVDAVHGDLLPHFPDITKRQVADTISGYGKTTHPSENEVRRQLGELGTQLRLISKLEDVRAGKAPLRTGYQRGEPSDDVRKLTKQVHDLMKKMGIQVTDESRQLKTALTAAKTRLRNLITDLRDQIAKGRRTPKKQGVNYDKDAQSLKDEVERLRTILREMEGKPEMSDEQKVKLAIAAAERGIQDYQDRINKGDFGPRPKKKGAPESPALKAARTRRDALRKEWEALKLAANPKLTPEQRALRAAKKRILKSMEALDKRIKDKDFSKPQNKKMALDQEYDKLRAEMERKRKDFRIMLERDRLSKLGTVRKAFRWAVKIRRAELISGLAVLEKLAIAANVRLVTTPLEDAVAAAWRYVPVVGKIVAKSPRYGSKFSIKTEAKAISDGFVNMVKNAPIRWRTGEAPWETNAMKDLGKGEFYDLDPSWLDFIGHLHMILKSPAVEAEYSRALAYRTRWALENGIDATAPGMEAAVRVAAYLDSQRAKLMQDNPISYLISQGQQAVERKWGDQGAIAADLSRLLFPLMKVSTNFAIEAGQYSPAGLPFALLWETPMALKGDIDKLPPEVADGIARHLAKGSIGMALFLLLLATGVAAKWAGGYFFKHKHVEGEPKAGQVKNIPQTATHTPAMEGTLTMAATVQRVLASAPEHKGDDPRDGYDAAVTAFGGLLGHLPAFQIPAELLEMGKGGKEGRDALHRMGTGFLVPQVINDIAKITDRAPGPDDNPKTLTEQLLIPGRRVDRDAKTFGQAVKAAIPGLRETVPVKSPARSTSLRKIPAWAILPP